MATDPVLSDGITTLRRFHAADADAFAAIHRDPLNIQWTGSVPTMDRAEALGFIDGHIAEGWEAGTNLRFAIVELRQGTPQVVGTLSLQDILSTARGGAAHVGIKMLPAGRGTTTAQRAMELLCGYAFGNLGLSHLHWACTAGNRGSTSLAHRSGFTLAAQIPGYGQVGGEVADGLVYTQSAESWNQRELRLEREPELDPAPVVPVLAGGKVVLRALTLADAPALVENCRDVDAVRWTTVPLNYSLEHAEYFINNITVDGWLTGRTLTFAVADTATDQLLGTIDLQCQNPGVASIGINMAAKARGSGASEAAVRLLLDYAFNQLNLSFAHWHTIVENWASRKLAWKLGFSFDGELRGAYNDRGTPADSWVLSLAAGDPQTPQQLWDGANRPE
ncbi:GNAT family N-acetyltransferase [Arthrobacter sp. Sr24]